MQDKKVIDVTLKATGYIAGRNVVPAQLDAQCNALCGQLCAGQGHVIELGSPVLCSGP